MLYISIRIGKYVNFHREHNQKVWKHSCRNVTERSPENNVNAHVKITHLSNEKRM